MDEEIARLRESIATAKADERFLKASLVALNAAITPQELREDIRGFETKRVEILSRLGPLRSGNVKPVSPEEKAEVDAAWKLWSSRANARKRICMEIWVLLTQDLPDGMTAADIWVGSPQAGRREGF
jgi:26S proteasome regulatory subunit (ATPase 3-interacting protein)